jgi:hypothetical protein
MKRVSTAKRLFVFYVLAVMLQCYLTCTRDRVFQPKPFDAAVWREHIHLHDMELDTQATRLINQRMLLGMHQAEVVELLGEPDRYELPQSPRDPGESDMVYPIQPNAGVGPDWEWLVVRSGADGRVSTCFISRE